ncbi:MAG: entericidin [Pseudomonadota bacterium]
MPSIAKTTMLLTATLMLLAACETTEGLGRDTQKLGNNISGAAEKNTPKPSSTGN